MNAKVQDLLDQISLLDARELSELRFALGKNLGVEHLNQDFEKGEGDNPAGVPLQPKAPVLSGNAKQTPTS